MKFSKILYSSLIVGLVLLFLPVLWLLGKAQQLEMRARGYRYNDGWARYEDITGKGRPYIDARL